MTTVTETSYTPFINKHLNEELNKTGYVVLHLLNNEETEYLKNFFISGNETQRNQFTTFATNDYDYKTLVHNAILKAYSRSIQSLFNGFVPFWGNFFSKPPQSPAMPLHADFQYVDEPAFISLNIWCPLVDTTTENGAFGVVPFSHKLVKQLRGTKITDSYRKNAKEIETEFGKVLEIKAGQAVIYDHRLLHYSLPNNSAIGRLASTMVMVPEGAPLWHYSANNEGDTTFYKYAITSAEDFLKAGFQQNLNHLPVAETIHNYRFHPLGAEDFRNYHKQYLNN